MFLSKFVFHLTSKPIPEPAQLDRELDHLLLRTGPVQPTYLHEYDERDSSDQIDKLDSEIVSKWLRHRFEPAMILLTVKSDDNVSFTKEELFKLKEYQDLINRLFRFKFLENYASQKIREFFFDLTSELNASLEFKKLQRTLTFLSAHLQGHENLTLFSSDKYTPADLVLVNYLRRIMIGKYHTYGLRSHIKNCDPLKHFLMRFKSKNPFVLMGDSCSAENEARSLISDLTRPAIFVLGTVLFFVWRFR